LKLRKISFLIATTILVRRLFGGTSWYKEKSLNGFSLILNCFGLKPIFVSLLKPRLEDRGNIFYWVLHNFSKEYVIE